MIFLLCVALHIIILLLILFNKSYLCVDFYLKLNLIKKIIKHNQVNYLYYNIKYIDLHLSLVFSYFLEKNNKP
jgi:hypothetical protein